MALQTVTDFGRAALDEEEKDYFCFHLTGTEMSTELQRRLERLGVECLLTAGAHEAYGIAPTTEAFLEELDEIDEVRFVERREPPCSK